MLRLTETRDADWVCSSCGAKDEAVRVHFDPGDSNAVARICNDCADTLEAMLRKRREVRHD